MYAYALEVCHWKLLVLWMLIMQVVEKWEGVVVS